MPFSFIECRWAKGWSFRESQEFWAFICAARQKKSRRDAKTKSDYLVLIVSSCIKFLFVNLGLTNVPSCLFHLASTPSGATKIIQRARIDEEEESAKLSKWHLTASEWVWTAGKSKISPEQTCYCKTTQHLHWHLWILVTWASPPLAMRETVSPIISPNLILASWYDCGSNLWLALADRPVFISWTSFPWY